MAEKRHMTGLTYDEAIAALAECYRLAGGDTDGNEDWRLAPDAVEEVRQLRQGYNHAIGIIHDISEPD